MNVYLGTLILRLGTAAYQQENIQYKGCLRQLQQNKQQYQQWKMLLLLDSFAADVMRFRWLNEMRDGHLVSQTTNRYCIMCITDLIQVQIAMKVRLLYQNVTREFVFMNQYY